MKERTNDIEEDQIGFLTERTKRRKRASNKSIELRLEACVGMCTTMHLDGNFE